MEAILEVAGRISRGCRKWSRKCGVVRGKRCKEEGSGSNDEGDIDKFGALILRNKPITPEPLPDLQFGILREVTESVAACFVRQAASSL